jgi:hypothetical protein
MIYLRVLVYSLSILVFRVAYLLSAFLLGFGSASDHTAEDVRLNVVLVTLNLIGAFIIFRYLKGVNKIELYLVASTIFIIWIALYLYYSN